MKKIIVMMVGLVGFSMASSSLTEIIEADKGCSVALSKSYKIASIRELQCKTVYAFAQKLKEHPSYRDFKRIKLLKEIQEKVELMDNVKDINWVLKDREIGNNRKSLKRLKWPSYNMLYFDVELTGDILSFIYATNNSAIKLNIQTEKLNSKELGNSVEVCSSDGSCIVISSPTIRLQNKKYSLLKIKSSQGTLSYKFSKWKTKDLVYLAYEIYAQLFNKATAPLSKVKIVKELSNE